MTMICTFGTLANSFAVGLVVGAVAALVVTWKLTR